MSDNAEQRDEMELLKTIMSREGEFQWEEADGVISGRLNATQTLEAPITLVHCSKKKDSSRSLKNTWKLSAAALEYSVVTHLPPICLYFSLPTDYPSHKMPEYSLSCNWLNFTQLTTLCVHLDRMWTEGQGHVILYTWYQFITSDVLATLGINRELRLDYEDPTHRHLTWDMRAVQDVTRPCLVVEKILAHDRREKERQFADTHFVCDVCFCSVLGSKCGQHQPCGHTHCHECLRSYLNMKIGSGDVTQLECPSNGCTTIVNPLTVKSLVSDALFNRYEKLLLQRTLDAMGDVVYCPRPSCRCTVLKEEDSNMAMCPKCEFAFCVLCKRAWHGVSPCRVLPGDLDGLKATYEALDEEGRRAMEAQYGKVNLGRAFEEHDSRKWIEGNSRGCPNCRANIEKTYGCNKMTCTSCHTHFCWLCGAVLSNQNPYRHFQFGVTSCSGKLFEGMTTEDLNLAEVEGEGD